MNEESDVYAGQTNQPHLQEHGCPHTIRIRLLQERRDRLGSKHRGPPAFGSVPSDLSHLRRIQCRVPEPMPPRVIVGERIRRIIRIIHQIFRGSISTKSPPVAWSTLEQSEFSRNTHPHYKSLHLLWNAHFTNRAGFYE